jgi:hypothetical protein
VDFLAALTGAFLGFLIDPLANLGFFLLLGVLVALFFVIFGFATFTDTFFLNVFFFGAILIAAWIFLEVVFLPLCLSLLMMSSKGLLRVAPGVLAWRFGGIRPMVVRSRVLPRRLFLRVESFRVSCFKPAAARGGFSFLIALDFSEIGGNATDFLKD